MIVSMEFYLSRLPETFDLKQARKVIGRRHYLVVLAVLIDSGYLSTNKDHSKFTKL